MKDLTREHWPRVIKEETSARKEKWKSAVSGKQLDSVEEETLEVSLPVRPRETDAITDTDPLPGQRAQSSFYF